MCMCMGKCLCACVCACLCACMSACVHKCMHAYVCVCMCLCVHVCVYMSVCTPVCIRECMRVCVLLVGLGFQSLYFALVDFELCSICNVRCCPVSFFCLWTPILPALFAEVLLAPCTVSTHFQTVHSEPLVRTRVYTSGRFYIPAGW